MEPLRFVPYHRLGDTPNVVVDGGPAPSTVLTLSHWPGSPTPVDLREDLSAQIAFRALERPALFDGVGVVSNNHFDQDGLASVFALVEPELAVARRDRIIDVARAGDFATFHDRDSARIAFALAAYADPEHSPLDAEVFAGNYDDQCGRLYQALLPGFAALVDAPSSSRALWEAEDAHLTESLAAIADGTVVVEEIPAVDLAVVTVPTAWADRVTSRFTIARTEAVHPAAVNQSTSCLRLLVVHDERYRLELRYESWVMFCSRPVLARPDLRVLAAELDDAEPGSTRWTADPPGALTPMMTTDGAVSGLTPLDLRARVVAFLADAPAAWDPYSPR